MRIISGTHKGRRLIAPKKLPVRPTTDFAKEALFNILNNHYYFDEVSVLDLFSGTGNISYEFASRGTKDITCVDAHSGCISFIQKTTKEFDLPIDTFKMDVYQYLNKEVRSFDIIFADPPYDFSQKQLLNIVSIIFERNLISEQGVLIIEHSKHVELYELSYFSYDKQYGGSVFSFFEK